MEARAKRERAAEERRLEKEAERLEAEAIAEAKRIEKEEIEAAKLEFRIDTANLNSDTHAPEIIEAFEEARGDLDTIDQELDALVANSEGPDYKENSEKCERLRQVRWKILNRCSELLSMKKQKKNQNSELGCPGDKGLGKGGAKRHRKV